jgi:hypothetical protein
MNPRSALAAARRIVIGLAILVVVAALTYALAHPWISTWGTTKEEARQSLPGDELVPNPTTQSTLAVTIDASPEEVWPWLVQMGADRGGFYTYLLIENTLLRLGVQNADRIHPEWQDIKVGDRFRFIPKDYPGPPLPGPVVAAMEPNGTLLMCMGGKIGEHCASRTWNFILEQKGEETTRLLLRSRDSGLDVFDRVLGPGISIMDRGMLLGIKQKAQGAPADRSLAERISFACALVAALGLVTMLFSGGKWRPQVLVVVSVGTCLTTLVFFVFYPSVAWGILLDLVVLGALLWMYSPERNQI